jgi:hypothetical protein
MSYLRHIVLRFCLRLVYPMLPVSLDFPFLITPSAFSSIYLQNDVQCSLCFGD